MTFLFFPWVLKLFLLQRTQEWPFIERTLPLATASAPASLPRWLCGKDSDCQCRRHRRREFDLWVGKMATPSTIPAWRIAWTGEPGGLLSLGRKSQTPPSDWVTYINSALATLKRCRKDWGASAVLATLNHRPLCLELTRTIDMMFSHSVMSDSLRLHELEHVRLPCPSPSHRACSNSCPLSQWCHSTSFLNVEF